jgi:4-amino-4-deoxy-L-arabinose transferase-like glycosyltransferase
MSGSPGSLTLQRASTVHDVRTGRDWAWLIALWAIVTAYNLFKPYHIDDTAHLEIARWIAAHPLHPMGGKLNWGGVDAPIPEVNQPHLYFYLLALWGRAFGFGEPAMHALQSSAALACILLFHRLARMLAAPAALWATAMLVLGPAFVVEQNLMVDVPLLAIWLVFFNALICEAHSARQTRRFLVAGLACAAALLTKYSSLALFPILCLALLLERRPAQAWTVLIPIAALAAWSLFNVLDYGGVHIIERPRAPLSAQRVLDFAAAWVIALGAITPLGLIAGLESRPGWVRKAGIVYGAVAAGFAALVTAVAFGALSDDWSDRVLWWAFAVNGALVCLAVALGLAPLLRRKLWRREIARDAAPSLYLLLWVMGATAFYVLFAPFVAVRHVLLILPPATLLALMRRGGSFTRVSRVFGLVATIVVSAGLCLSDWRFAAFYRSEAAILGRDLATAGTVWASGHWGWQWYAARSGFRQVDVVSSDLRPGDYFVVAPLIDHQELRRPPPMRLVRTDTQRRPLLNLLCTGREVRFYSSSISFGPWSVSRACLGRMEVFEIEK